VLHTRARRHEQRVSLELGQLHSYSTKYREQLKHIVVQSLTVSVHTLTRRRVEKEWQKTRSWRQNRKNLNRVKMQGISGAKICRAQGAAEVHVVRFN
jgi:hypothetical protein